MAKVTPERDPPDNDRSASKGDDFDDELQDDPKGSLSEKVHHGFNSLCTFQISDLVEDKCRVRVLNVLAYVLMYVFVIFALLKTFPPLPAGVKNVRFANPPPAYWLSGLVDTDLYRSLLPERKQKIWVQNDQGAPEPGASVKVIVTDFQHSGPLPCSKADQDAMMGTNEFLRIQHVCDFGRVSWTPGTTDKLGFMTLENFTVEGPTGLYNLRAAASGSSKAHEVQSTQDTKMQLGTPVTTMRVLQDAQGFPELPAPESCESGKPLAVQPVIQLLNARGLPVPGRTVIAFASPDPTWPPTGARAQASPDYYRRGQKIVELSCSRSEPSDDAGLARFTCLGVKGSNVDHLYWVFTDSASVFYPWNDPAYSPMSLYPAFPMKFRFPTFIVSSVSNVEVTTKMGEATEGVPFSPTPKLRVTDSTGKPVTGVRCYAMIWSEKMLVLPEHFRQKTLGAASKELLDAAATTDENGVAQFQNMRMSIHGNLVNKEVTNMLNPNLGRHFWIIAADQGSNAVSYHTEQYVGRGAGDSLQIYETWEDGFARFEFVITPDGDSFWLMVFDNKTWALHVLVLCNEDETPRMVKFEGSIPDCAEFGIQRTADGAGYFSIMAFGNSSTMPQQGGLYLSKCKDDSNFKASKTVSSCETFYIDRPALDLGFTIGFNCDGVMNEDSAGFLDKVKAVTAEVRIKRFLRTQAVVVPYYSEPQEDGSDIFQAVIRVVDARGKGVPGKTVSVEFIEEQGGAAMIALEPSTMEPTNDMGFAIVAFQMISGSPGMKKDGSMEFSVRFSVDQVASAISERLTAQLRGEVTPERCHYIEPTSAVSIDTSTSQVIATQPYQKVYTKSGDIFIGAVRFVGQTVDVCAHFPSLIAPLKADETACNPGKRRLEEEDLGRKLREIDDETWNKASRSRRLQSLSGSDGSVILEWRSMYSTDMDRNGKVKYQPEPFLKMAIITDPALLTALNLPAEPLTLKDLSLKPGSVPIAMQFDGPAGDHFIQLFATFTKPDGSSQTCTHTALSLSIQNPLEAIVVEGDAGEGAWFDYTIEASGSFDITLRFMPEKSMTVPDCLHMANRFWDICSVKFTFVEAPYNYHTALGMQEDEDGWPDAYPLDTEWYSIAPVTTSPYNAQGYDSSTWSMKLRFTSKKRGLYGNFGIQFHSFGVKSRVLTWRIQPPAGLDISVVTAPAVPFWRSNYLPGDILWPYPVVSVTSASGPVEGLIVSYLLEAEPGARFSRLSDLPMYSPLPMLYSLPSNASGLAAYGENNPAMVLDGSGCVRFKFIAEGLETEAVPAEPICVTAPWHVELAGKPPDSLPLAMSVGEIGSGGIAVELRPSLASLGRVSDLASFGIAAMRIMVINLGDEDLSSDVEAMDVVSQGMFDEATCFWVEGRELIGRCSNLTLLQTLPYPVIRFSFQTFNWARLLQLPGKMKFVVTDLSGSTLASAGNAAKPANFDNMSASKQAQSCVSAVTAAASLRGAVSDTIDAETEPSQYSIEIPPPDVVVVGSMFLVRLRVLTKSGGPVRGQQIRVGIKSGSATSSSSVGTDTLQKMAQNGNTINVVANGNVELDNATLVRTSKADGTVNFPITIARAASGTFILQFQPETAGGKVVKESAAFKVNNEITAISSPDGAWDKIGVQEFGELVDVPRLPTFNVTTSSGRTLQHMSDEGIAIRIRLKLKGVSTKKSAVQKEIEKTKKEAVANAKAEAEKKFQAMQKAAAGVVPHVAEAVSNYISSATSNAIGAFSGLSEDFALSCMNTAAASLQAGDVSLLSSLNGSQFDMTQDATLAEAAFKNADVIDPTEMFSQFTGVLMSGGLSMKPREDMKIQGEWELDLADIELQTDGTYKITKGLKFAFSDNMKYAFTLAINGVQGRDSDFEAFRVELLPPDPVNVFFNWLASAVSGVVGVIVLTSNTTEHPWCWLLIAMIATICLLVATPFLGEHRLALGGNWTLVAVIALALILVGLVYGIAVEFVPSATTFADRRKAAFERYTKKKLAELLKTGTPTLEKTSLLKMLKNTFIRPLNEDDAFYWSSNMLISTTLQLLTFVWLLVTSINTLRGIRDALNSMVNRAIESAVQFTETINNQYYQATLTDLPDSSTQFMYSQIELMKSWFNDLAWSLELGMWIGVVIAAIITGVSLIGMFVHFRLSVLDARRGKFGFKKKDAKVQYSATFIGVNISSTIVSYILLVIVICLITIPFSYPIVWRLLWSYAPFVWWTFVFPAVISAVSRLILKKCVFTNFLYRSRGGASIYIFYQTWLALVGGFVGAVVRFILGIVGTLVMLPVVYGANTPDLVNKVYLLDASYRVYISEVLTHANHNNPIATTAAYRLLAVRDTHMQWTAAGKHWTSTKRMLLLILLRFPELRKFRKHALQQERELLKLQKELAKSKASEIAVESNEAKKQDASKAWMGNSIADEEAFIAARTLRLEKMKALRLRIALLSKNDSNDEAAQELEIELRELCEAGSQS